MTSAPRESAKVKKRPRHFLIEPSDHLLINAAINRSERLKGKHEIEETDDVIRRSVLSESAGYFVDGGD